MFPYPQNRPAATIGVSGCPAQPSTTDQGYRPP